MNCSKAHEYFVKHVDNCISLMESEWLDKHLMKCEECREDFAAYEAVVGAILAETTETVPSGLETAIMGQIEELSLANKDTALDKSNSRLFIVFGISFAVIMVMVLAIAMGQETIEQLQSTLQGAFTARFGEVLDKTRLSLDNFTANIYSLLGTLDTLFERVYFGVLLAVVTLVFIQLTLWRKNRATQ